MDLEQSFKNLKQSPMFAISLSSKELFHSNFWAWLIEHNPEYSKVFFDDIDFNIKLSVKREEKNRDLSIHLNQWVYIIENKLKSLPSREQIEEYQKKEPSFCKGCLTGVVRLEDLPNNWCFKSYKEIGTSIIKINEKYVEAKAMIDTGNLLKEPITQKDVIIVEKNDSAVANVKCTMQA